MTTKNNNNYTNIRIMSKILMMSPHRPLLSPVKNAFNYTTEINMLRKLALSSVTISVRTFLWAVW